MLKQHVWNTAASGYIDELVQIGLNDDPTDTEQDVESFYWATHNANFNVMALVDPGGVIVERYEYTPYGERTVYFSPGANDPEAMAPTAISRRWTTSGGTAQPYGLNDIGHQGLMHDEEAGLVDNRARMLHPGLKRFIQRDPLRYVDGMNSYAAYGILTGNLDPTGKCTGCGSLLNRLTSPCGSITIKGKPTGVSIKKISGVCWGQLKVGTATEEIKNELAKHLPFEKSLSCDEGETCKIYETIPINLTIGPITRTGSALGGSCKYSVTFSIAVTGEINLGECCPE